VTPLLVEEIHDMAGISGHAVQDVQHCGLARSGDTIVVIAGIPLGQPGRTNLLKVEQVP
jgi:pyruvate kinase